MIALTRAFRAEMLKIKRTLALWMVFLTPLAIVGLSIVASIIQRAQGKPEGNAWDNFSQSNFLLWGLLMLPLFISLETALLGQLEIADKNWKHLFALPIPRSALYAAKLMMGAGLVGLSTVVLWGGILIGGYFLRWVTPGMGFEAAVPWAETLQTALFSYLAAWFILALHTWVILRWQSFTLSVGLGMIATVLGVFLTSSASWARFYPWALPSLAMSGDRSLVTQALLFGVIGGILVAAAGCWDMVRQDVL